MYLVISNVFHTIIYKSALDRIVTAKVSSIQEPKLTAGDYMLSYVAHRFFYTLFFLQILNSLYLLREKNDFQSAQNDSEIFAKNFRITAILPCL